MRSRRLYEEGEGDPRIARNPRYALRSMMMLLLSAACGLPRPSFDSASRDTGQDSADTGETGETAETAEDTSPTVAFDLSGDLDGLAFAFVQLPVSEAGFVTGEVLHEQAPAPRIELRPDPTPYVQPLPDIVGLEGAFFVGGLHEDDGNLTWDPEERWFAAGSWMALYLDGELPELMALAGWQLGWNSILIDGAAIPALGDPLALPLINGYVDALALAGTADAALPEGTRFALVPAPVFAGDAVDALLVDEPLGTPWSVSVAGAPDPSHFLDIDGDGFTEAVESFVVYDDADGSESVSTGDAGLGGVCSFEGANAHQGIGLFYSPPSTSVLWPVYFAAAGASLGWNAFAADPGAETLRFLDSDALTDLVASTECAVE